MPQSFRAIITLEDEGGGGRPDQGLPGGPPGHISNRPPGSGGPGQGNKPLPIWPSDPPPGTIWPPLPPDFQPDDGSTTAIICVLVEGVGYRYVVIEVGDNVDNELPGEPDTPDNELPGEGDEGPDQGLPGGPPTHPGNRPPGSGAPPRPGQGLPTPPPPRPGNRPPGAPPPPRPGQGLPPSMGPKPGPAGQRR